MYISLVDIIFKGEVSKIDLCFLKGLILNSDKVRFCIPEIESIDYDLIVNVLNNHEYVDLGFENYNLKPISNVFVNLVLDNNKIELLFFLDLKDIHAETYSKSLEKLKVWAIKFGKKYHFHSVLCRPDGGNEDEFHFKDII